MAHHIAPDGKIYADTAFLNAAGRLPGVEVKHMGFGEFYLETSKGKIDFDRMRGKDFPGQSGRSHQVYPEKLALDLIKQMEQKGLSERMALLKRADQLNDRIASKVAGPMRTKNEVKAASRMAKLIAQQVALAAGKATSPKNRRDVIDAESALRVAREEASELVKALDSALESIEHDINVLW